VISINYQALPAEDLHQMCLRGDQGAWTFIYNYVLAICRWKKWNLRDDPQDLAQAIVIHLIEKGIDNLRDEKAFLAFVKRLAVNHILDSFKTPNPRMCSLDQPQKDGKGDEYNEEYPDPKSSLEQEAELREMIEVIDRYFCRIPKYCRSVLTCYFQMKLGLYQDYQEISRVLKSPVGTISAQVRRCLNAFIRIKEIRELL